MAWTIGNVAPMTYGKGETGYGFNIVDQNGRSLVTFVYDDESEAGVAAMAMRAAVVRAVSVKAVN